MSITTPRFNPVPASNPSFFDQRQRVTTSPPDALSNLPLSPGAAVQGQAPETTQPETTLRPQDTFVQDASAEATQAFLSPVFALRSQSGLGANAPDLQVLANFSTQVIPDAIGQLNERISALEQAEPAAENQLALDNARASLELYKQAEELLAASPLLVLTNPIANPPAPDYAALADAASLGGEWSTEQRRAYSRSIEADASRNEPTPFTLKIDQLKAQREQLSGSEPAGVSEATGRAIALIDELINVYEQLERSFDAGGTDRNRDSTALLEKLQPLSQALENAKEDLEPAQYAQINKQIGEFRTLAAVFAQPGKKIEGNLGRLVSRTYRRQDQIISGERKRANETADLSGALQTFSNDAADMAIFVSRLGDLASEIRSGLPRERAIAKARESIAGTRADFQQAFLALVNAEVDIYEAEQAAKLAQNKISEGEALEPELQSALASGQAARREARADGQLAREASRSGKISDAQAHQARYVQGHETAVGETARAGEILARRQGLEQEADRALARSQQRQRSGRDNISVAQGSDFSKELSAGIAGATGEAARVDGVIASTQTQLDVYKASNADFAVQVAQAQTADEAQGKAVDLTGEAIRLREIALEQQRQDNQNAADSILEGIKNGSQSSEGEFKISGYYGAGFSGMRGEVGVSASIGVKAEKDGDAYILTMTFKGEASAELSTFFYSVKGAYSKAFTEGIKLDNAQEVEVFTRLLGDFTEQISANGLTSDESIRARDALLEYIELNRRSQTEDKGTLTVNIMGQESEFSVATGTVVQDGFRDLNQDGERGVGEARTREISTYRTVKGSVEFSSATLEISVKRTFDQRERPTGKKIEIGIETGVPLPSLAVFSRSLLENRDLELPPDEIRNAYSALLTQSRAGGTGKLVATVDIPVREPATFQVAAVVEDESKLGGRTRNPTGANVGIQVRTKDVTEVVLMEGTV